MIVRDGHTRRSSHETGFTVVELLVYLVISVVVLGALYQLLIGQQRLYSKQQELMDLRGALRSATEFLAFELRSRSPTGGDIDNLSPHSVSLRSVISSGVACEYDASQGRMGLVSVQAADTVAAGDSVLIFATGDEGQGDDYWVATSIQQVWQSDGGISSCAWSEPTELVVAVDTIDGSFFDDLNTGAPIQTFYWVDYGLFQKAEDGRWWLGLKPSAASDWEILTGPMRPPSDSGLAFYYYDDTGSPTADPSQVRLVEVLLSGESQRGVRKPGGAPGPALDTLRTRVWLRGG